MAEITRQNFSIAADAVSSKIHIDRDCVKAFSLLNQEVNHEL